MSSMLWSSCIKKEPHNTTSTAPQDTLSQRVLMVCEGSLGNGNAELSVYYPLKDSCYTNVFWNANQFYLGDVFQSLTQLNKQYYLCINNSDKIVVCAKDNFKQSTTINVPKPRNVLQISPDKAYVGSLFQNKIHVLNPSAHQVSTSIDMPKQNVEGMLFKDNAVYIACWDTSCYSIYILDPLSNALKDSIYINAAAPQSILEDKYHRLWVFSGNPYKSKVNKITIVDINSKTIIKQYTLNVASELIKPQMNEAKDSLFYLRVNYLANTSDNGLFVMGIDDDKIPSTALVPCASYQYFWALGLDPNSNQIYLGDPKGFTQKSQVYIYNKKGILQKQLLVNIGISAFIFE